MPIFNRLCIITMLVLYGNEQCLRLGPLLLAISALDNILTTVLVPPVVLFIDTDWLIVSPPRCSLARHSVNRGKCMIYDDARLEAEKTQLRGVGLSRSIALVTTRKRMSSSSIAQFPSYFVAFLDEIVPHQAFLNTLRHVISFIFLESYILCPGQRGAGCLVCTVLPAACVCSRLCVRRAARCI